MITLFYAISGYILTGLIIYILGNKSHFSALTPFKEEIFLLSGLIFRPVILAMLWIDTFKDNLTYKRMKESLTKDEKEAVKEIVSNGIRGIDREKEIN